MFDRYLAAQAQPRSLWESLTSGKRPILVVSVIIHAAFVVALMIWSVFHVEEVPAPLLTVTFFRAAAPPPPPPPPPPAGGKKKPTTTKKTPTPTTLVQPKDVKPLEAPKEPEPVKDEPEDDGQEGGVEGGVKGGVAGGVVGGVEGGVVGGLGTGPAPPPPPEVKPKNVPPHVLEQSVLHREKFKLPPAIESLHRGEELRFTILMCIDTSGAVDVPRTRILAGLPGTEEIVLGAVRQWRYRPQPIPVCSPLIIFYKVE